MSRAAAIDVSPSDLQIVRGILRRLVPERQIWAFGSRVTGNARRYSDLDLALIGDEPISLSVMAQLAEAFSASDLPFKVDLVDWARSSVAFRDVIRANHVVVQSK